MELHGGQTQPVGDSFNNWYDDMCEAQKNIDIELETILSHKSTCDLLKSFRPAPFYRFLIYYLIFKHKTDLQTNTDKKRADCMARICSVIEKKPKEENAKPLSAEERKEKRANKQLYQTLVALMMQDFITNGFAKVEDANKGTYSVLVDLKDENRRILSLNQFRDRFFQKSITEQNFFVLALGLHMSSDDIDLFLKKALLRKELDYWNIEEVLVFLCADYGFASTTDIPTFYRNALAKYEELTKETNSSDDTAGSSANAQIETQFLREKAETFQKGMSSQLTTDSPNFDTFLEQYASLTKHANRHKHARVKLFLDLTEASEKNLVKLFDSSQAFDAFILEQWTQMMERFEVDPEHAHPDIYGETAEIRNYRLCRYLYELPFDIGEYAEILFGGSDPAELMQLLEESRLLRNRKITDTFLSNLHTYRKNDVSRDQMLTVAFIEAMSWCEASSNKYTNGLDRMLDIQQRVNEALEEAGFYEIYLPNPYDCLLMSCCACDEPLQMYRTLWSFYGFFSYYQKGGALKNGEKNASGKQNGKNTAS